MAAPTYTNAGNANISAGATSLSPTLPASRVNGNILVAVCGSKNNATHSISGSGWQALGTQTNSGTGLTVSLWWRVVDGSETQPTISWSGSVACRAIIWQFTRQNFDSTSPFGTIGTPGTGTTSTHTSTGFNSTRNNSLIVYIDMAAANTALAEPSGWTERDDAGSATGAMRSAAGDKTLATSGSASGNISVTGASTAWVQRQIELLEPLISGSMATAESGADTATIAGDVLVKGALAVSEAGPDTAAVAGVVFVRGSLAVNEDGSDTAALSGAVAWPTASGALAAGEAGSDTASLDGIVFTAPRIGVFAAIETGSDAAGFSGVITGEGFLWFPMPQPTGDWIIGAASGTWTPVSAPATDWT